MLKRLGFADIIAIGVRGKENRRLGLDCDNLLDFKPKREI